MSLQLYSRFTFHSNKYLTVAGVKLKSVLETEKSEMGSTQQTSNVFSICCQSEKKVYFHLFIVFLRVFWCFTCNIGRSLFHQYGHVQGPKNTSSKQN